MPAALGQPRWRGKLVSYQAFLDQLVAKDPDITLYKLRGALAMAEDVVVHHPSIAHCSSGSVSAVRKPCWPPNSTTSVQSKPGTSGRSGAFPSCYASLLSPERDNAASFGIAVGMLRRALKALTGKGFLVRVPGSGNYVRARPDCQAKCAARFPGTAPW